MITLRKYEDEDWEKITDATEPLAPLDMPDDFKNISERSVAVTGEENGKVMACGGITFVGNDEGVVWVKVSDKCKKKAYTWSRTIIESFRLMKDSIKGMKITAYVKKDFCKGIKLAELIGLENTGTAEHDGRLYYTYSTVIK